MVKIQYCKCGRPILKCNCPKKVEESISSFTNSSFKTVLDEKTEVLKKEYADFTQQTENEMKKSINLAMDELNSLYSKVQEKDEELKEKIQKIEELTKKEKELEFKLGECKDCNYGYENPEKKEFCESHASLSVLSTSKKKKNAIPYDGTDKAKKTKVKSSRNSLTSNRKKRLKSKPLSKN